ncbi:hypothetical protein MBELCI_3622 [Limimaricola cinnabarinus LL-001]|uniref:Uncharacterized protein n=1 Tax=Limimaricola cinnabarinus LL-001 TaxID=1337093 RepID=U2Z7Y4_9RHOB|nr:hypothetical protein MBELCI_3622 [Limimaricola cinnabarinus LL-001]
MELCHAAAWRRGGGVSAHGFAARRDPRAPEASGDPAWPRERAGLAPAASRLLGSGLDLAGWSETAKGFAELRVDRITALRVLPQLFVDEAGRTLADLEASRG